LSEYELIPEPPDVDSYVELRTAAGLSERTRRAAELGLSGTWFGVHVVHGDRVVAMGRVIGDGGSFFQIVDVAVAPDYQGKGLGKRVMGTLVERLRTQAPPTAQVTLLADGTAFRLYEKFGFRRTAPGSIGMLLQP
jgi:ribosomal protein S18 acetylase RimI-like enzyme